MPTIKIKSIKHRSTLSDEDYIFILDNLEKDLPLMSINYMPDGVPFSFAVYKSDKEVISLFVDANKLEYRLSSPLDDAIRVLVERVDIVKNIHNFSKQSYVHGLMDGRVDEINTLISMLEEMR